MKFGETREIDITDIDEKGRGRGVADGKAACVPFTVPGERVEGRFVGRGKGVGRFALDRVVTPSPDRTAPRCPHAGSCGGCAWQHVAYDRQLEMKRDLINAALAAHAVPMTVDRVEGAPSLFRYRNRMDFCVGWKGEVGLKEPGRWNAYVDLSTCHLISEDGVRALAAFRDWMRENGIEPWDAKFARGYARYLVVRESVRTGQRLLIVVTADGDLPAKDDLLSRFDGLATTVVHGVNPTITDVSLPSRTETLKGDPWFEEEVAGLRFRVPPTSFFQTNTEMAERLLAAVRDRVASARPRALLDLYCGVGFMGIGCASAAGEVVGYEIDEAAAEVADGNARRNGISNATFFAGKAEDLPWRDRDLDMVIVDPPRAGLHPRVIDTLLDRLPERIVYVSCNYRSFARDWDRLREKYRLDSLRAFDLFPQTPHAELVASLVRN